MRRVELFELIRHDYFDFGISIRGIARKRGIHRRVVRQAIASAVPPDRKRPRREPPKLTQQVRGFIDGILISDKTAPRKQRHTARRIFERARDEMGSAAAESTVRAYVRGRKRELSVGQKVYVPQHHPPGAQGEVDFYESFFEFPEGLRKAQVIAVRSEFSGAALHVAYPSQTQSALLEGMQWGFEFLGGAFGVMRFDNLRQAVARVIRGQRRVEQDRFIAFRSHYLFEASFTSLGIEGAHEKGGIEGEIGRFRRRWLTPVPKVRSWQEANAYLRACCIKDLGRTAETKSMSVGELAEIERGFLRALPAEGFELGEVAEARVDDKARIKVRNCRYSVPASLSGRKVSVRLSPISVEVSYGGRVVATHDRLHLKSSETLVLDHFLDVLLDKPGAFPGSLPLHQARERGEFPASYDRLWRLLAARYGEKPGTKKMIEVLLLHRRYDKQVVRGAVEQALELGAADSSAVAALARQLASDEGVSFQPALLDVGELARYDRPLPETSRYDALVGGAR